MLFYGFFYRMSFFKKFRIIFNCLFVVLVEFSLSFKFLNEIHGLEHLLTFAVGAVSLQGVDSGEDLLFFGVLLGDTDLGEFL